MELTPEDKQQIEEEERRRLAEEEYRAQVRAKLRGAEPAARSAGFPAGHGSQADSKRPRSGWRLFGFLAVGVILAFVVIGGVSELQQRIVSWRRAALPPSVRYVPASQKIASGQVFVKAGGYSHYRIRIEPDMREARVRGSFTASGGSGNNINAVLAEERDYQNWINGHAARVYWGTQGKQTTGSFDVRLGPGTYYLAFSNRFSALSDKYVSIEADLNYQRLETY